MAADLVSIPLTLASLAKVASTADNVHDTCAAFLDALLVKSKYEVGFVFQVNWTARAASPLVIRGIPHQVKLDALAICVDDYPYYQVFIQGVPVQVAGSTSLDFVLPVRRRPLASLLIPVHDRNKVIGCMEIVYDVSQDVSNEEMDLLVAAGHLLGGAIANIERVQDLFVQTKSMHDIFENASDMIVVLDMQGNILKINETLRRKLEYFEEELVGRNILFLHVPTDIMHAAVALKKMGCGLIDRHKGSLLTKSGALVQIEMRISHGVWNGADALVGILRDMGEYDQVIEALSKSEDAYRKLSENIPGIVYRITLGKEYETHFFNDGLFAMTGFKKTELKHGGLCNLEMLIVSEELPAVKDSLLEAMKKNGAYEFSYRIRHKDGGIKHFSERGRVLSDANGKPLYLDGIIFDITEMKLIEEALKQSEQRWKFAVEGSGSGVWEWDMVSSQIKCSDYWHEMLGYDKGEMSNKAGNMWDIIHQDDQAQLMRAFEECRDGERPFFEVEHRIKNKLGVYTWVLSRGRVVSILADGQIGRIVGTHTDISERKSVDEKIRYLSFHDYLTGLYNRAYFEEELRRIDTWRNLPVSIIIGDANKLKKANDTYGHAVGDAMLKKIADIIKESCRKDDVASRWGGDEFAIILPRSDESIAREICERIEKLCLADESSPVRPDISLGFATKHEPEKKMHEIIKEAEDMMYDKKKLTCCGGR